MSRNNYLYTFFTVAALYIVLQACQGEEAIRTAQYAANGQKIYRMKCQNCHGANGEGLGLLYPPLTDSVFLREYRSQLAGMVKNGISGPMVVNGQEFDGEMPPNPQLTPIEIAYVLTYISNAFGNNEGLYSLEDVQQSLEVNPGLTQSQ